MYLVMEQGCAEGERRVSEGIDELSQSTSLVANRRTTDKSTDD